MTTRSDRVKAAKASERLARRAGRDLDGKQIQLFGVVASEKKRIGEAHQRLIEAQRALQSASQEAFDNRRPLSYKSGFVLVPIELLYATDISSQDIHVLLVLMRYCIKSQRKAWPSENTIAEAVGKSVRTVQRSLTRLVRRGYLTISLQRSPSGNWINCYWVNIEEQTSCTR